MALTEKLTNIADAIRTKTGGTDQLTLEGMATAIAGIETGDGDNSVLTALIDRSLTEIESNATTLGAHIFRSCTNLVSASFPEATTLNSYALAQCSALKKIYIPKAKTISGYVFQEVAVEEISLPSFTGTLNTAFLNAKSLRKVDIGNNKCNITTNAFNGAASFTTLILRYTDNVIALTNVAAFNNSPFASGGTGGTVYVPQALIESYKTATNWSTLYAAGTCNFVAIEGSEYE